jgi:hypothetical protein
MTKGRREPIRQKPPIQPRRTDQWAHSDVAIEQQQLIGLLVLNWSKLETDIDGAIWAFLDLVVGTKPMTPAIEPHIEIASSLCSSQ